MFSSAHATNDSLSLYVTQFERASNRHLNGQPEIVRVRQIARSEREAWMLTQSIQEPLFAPRNEHGHSFWVENIAACNAFKFADANRRARFN